MYEITGKLLQLIHFLLYTVQINKYISNPLFTQRENSLFEALQGEKQVLVTPSTTPSLYNINSILWNDIRR